MDYEHRSIGLFLRKYIMHFVLFFLVLFAVIIILFLFFQRDANENILICGDGASYGNCSASRPFFCEEGVLIEKSSICECYNDYSKVGESCFNVIYTNKLQNSFSYFLNGKFEKINLTLYRGVYDYIDTLPRSIYYSGNETPNRRDFVLLKIEDEIQAQAIQELIIKIQNLAPESRLNQARIAISLVQNIPYSDSGENIRFAGNSIELSRFPYQVLYDNSGTCEEKSELLIFILRELGYGVSAFYYYEENHEAVGIKCPFGKSLDESGYCFVETTAPSILGDYEGEYPGVGKLLSKPEVIFIEEGLSLPKNLFEYKDSKRIMRLRDGKFIFIFSKDNFLKKMYERYGILF